MNIRKIDEYDIPEIVELNVEAFPNTPREQAAYVFERVLRSGIPGACLLAEEDGEIVGAIFCEEKITFTKNQARIKSIVVKKGMRRRGIGTGLMNAAMDALHDYSTIALSVENGNELAMRFYEKFGFRQYRIEYIK